MTEKKSEQHETKPSDEALEVQRAILEEMRQANMLKRQELGRAAEQPDQKLVDWARASEETRQAVVEARGEPQEIPLRVTFRSDDFGSLTGKVKVVVLKEHLDEPRPSDTSSSCLGKHRIHQVLDLDINEASDVVRKKIHAPHREELERLEREHRGVAAAAYRERLELGVAGAGGVAIEPGVRQSVYESFTRKTFALLAGALLEDVLASGQARRVDTAVAA